MKNVDFLPDQYHQQNAHRRFARLRVAVLVLFVAVLAAATAGQYALRRSIRAELVSVRAHYDDAVADGRQLMRLQAELQAERAIAGLITYLRHPWPRTRIISAALADLPRDATLQRLEIIGDTPGAAGPGKPPPRYGQQPKADAASQPAAQHDLDRLRDQFDSLETIVHLEGVTPSAATLHQYVEALAGSALFAKAELVSMDRQDQKQQAFHFHIRLVVRPGYGQPGGPRPAAPRSESVRMVDGRWSHWVFSPRSSP